MTTWLDRMLTPARSATFEVARFSPVHGAFAFRPAIYRGLRCTSGNRFRQPHSWGLCEGFAGFSPSVAHTAQHQRAPAMVHVRQASRQPSSSAERHPPVAALFDRGKPAMPDKVGRRGPSATRSLKRRRFARPVGQGLTDLLSNSFRGSTFGTHYREAPASPGAICFGDCPRSARSSPIKTTIAGSPSSTTPQTGSSGSATRIPKAPRPAVERFIFG